MLPSTKAVEDVYEGSDGILAAASTVPGPPLRLIDSSTISPVYTRHLEGRIKEQHGAAARREITFLDAPVSGKIMSLWNV